MAQIANTTTLHVGTAGGDATTKIGEVSSISFGGSTPEVDTTTLESTARDVIGGLPNYGSMDITVFAADDTGQTTLETAKQDHVNRSFKITVSDGIDVNYTFDGAITNFVTTMNPGEAIMHNISIAIDGRITKADN